MSHIVKFKSFEEASDSALKEYFGKKFDAEKAEVFIREYSGRIKNPYRPGIYRFGSFKEAREYDLERYIQRSVG